MHPSKYSSALPRHACARGQIRAFTLIELLTVIAIIGVLAAILIPTIGRVRESAKSSTCTNNLRQIGMAIQGYASDNKGSLPPATPWVTPLFNADPRHFQTALVPYIGITKAPSWTINSSHAPMFACPGYKETTGSHYVLNQSIKRDDGTSFSPNPWPVVYQNQQNGQFVIPKTAKIAEIPAKNQAILDRDPSATSPNHSGHKNALYFDWHVARVATN
jgi:prepilin-type N-terminal cleavage/methylation domain-containing protein/prepilin-type processing-associated H-X9-DG protein